MKTITILLLSLLMLSCGARKRNLDKISDENSEKIEQTSNSESSYKINKSIKSFDAEDLSNFNLIVKNDSENNDCGNVVVTDKNGNKTEIPTSGKSEVILGKVSVEKKQIKEETDKSEFNEKTISELKAENESLKKSLNNQTERKGVSFGDILLIIGVSVIIGVIATLAVQSRLKFIS